MYNLLLVDDEVLIADGLFDTLEEETMENLYLMKAYSVQEALETAASKRIDVLLTDINMPDMDGFALYERMLKLWPYCRVIFLTGFQSFDYAYKAIQYKNVRYIIKAEGVDKVISVVNEVIGELDQCLEEKNVEVFDLEKESKERLLKEILLTYFNGDIEVEELYNPELRQVGFRLNLAGPLYLAGAKIDWNSGVTTYGERIGFVKDINAMLRSHLPTNFQMVPLALNQGILWLLQPEEGAFAEGEFPYEEGGLRRTENFCQTQERCQAEEYHSADGPKGELSGYLMNIFDLFQVHLKSAFDIDTVVVVCKAAKISEVRQEFHQLYKMLRTQMFFEGNLLTYEELQKIFKNRTRPDAQEICTDAVKQRVPRLSHALEIQDRDLFFREAEPVFQALRSVKSRHSLQAKEVYLTVSLCMLSFISQTGLYENLPFELSLTPLTNPEEFSGWKEGADYLKMLAEAVFRVNRERNSDDMNQVITRVEQLVEENLERDVSITGLAEELYFNSYYLSRMFKNIKGVTLSDYITERKMNRAKELLKNPDVRVQTIGERMGYSSPANFIRSFKKYFGVTPNEYRRNYGMNKVTVHVTVHR